MDKFPIRKQFATGEFITRYPPGYQYSISIDSILPKTNWKARITEPQKAVFPGSAVEFEGNYYEVVALESTHSISRHVYHLRPWEDRFPIRTQFHYSREECRKIQREHLDQRRMRNKSIVVTMLMPLIGMLPASDQIRIGNQYGVPATRLTNVSSFTFLVLGIYMTARLIIHNFFGTQLPGPLQLFLFGPYFILEFLVRMYSVFSNGHPMGSLPVWFPLEMFRMVRNLWTGEKRKDESGITAASHQYDVFRNVKDEVKEVEGLEHDLEITSLLPKPHWTRLTGIAYKGAWYGLLDSQTVPVGEKSILYKFHLKLAREGIVFRNTTNYDPSEIQEWLRQKRDQDLGTWVETFSMFWGLLDGESQKALEKKFNYEALKYTRWSIVAMGVIGMTNLIASILNLKHEIGTNWELLWLFSSVYLLLESYSRWQLLQKQRPSGSILGLFLKPLSSKFLKEF